MKFLIEINDNAEHRLLNYIASEYSFDIEPAISEINFDIVVNKLNLTVVDDNKIVQVWGYCPYTSWIKSNYETPECRKGVLKVETDSDPGFAFSINNEKDWPVYVNPQTGWVCIGDPEKEGEAVEFINNCKAIVNNGNLISLWLKPQKLPNELV